MSRTAEALQTLVDTHGDTLRGVSYCSHYEGVAVYIAEDADQGTLDAIDAIIRSTDTLVVTHRQGLSLSELNVIVGELAGLMQKDAGIVSVGPNITTGGIDVGVNEAHLTTDEAHRLITRRLAESRVPHVELPLTLIPQSGAAHVSADVG